jgi:hypothetical protein
MARYALLAAISDYERMSEQRGAARRRRGVQLILLL